MAQRGDLPPPAPQGTIWTAPWLLAIGAVCIGIEGVLQLADLRILGTPLWRGLAYQNGAFWAGLLHNWQPNYAIQPGTMFLTYAFLHGGLGHLIGNMLSLIGLSGVALERVGQGRTVVIYTLSALGGAVLHGLVTSNPQPMVGASGALFGLAGAWQYWAYTDIPDRRRRLWHLARAVAALLVLNIVLWWAMGGALAWQTHLGGAIAGWFAARWVTPTKRRNPDGA